MEHPQGVAPRRMCRFGQQGGVELLEGTRLGCRDDRGTLEQVLQIVIVFSFSPRIEAGFFERSSCPST